MQKVNQITPPSATSTRTATGDRRPGAVVGTGLSAFGSVPQGVTPQTGAQGGNFFQKWWNTPSGQPGTQQATARNELANVITGQLPAGAKVVGAKSGATAVGANGQSIPTDPKQYYPGVTDNPNFQPTAALLNTPPEKAALYAPAIQDAMNELRNAAQGLPNNLSKNKIDLLFITGVLDANSPDDVAKANQLLNGSSALSGSPSDGLSASGAGKWDPWTNYGAKPIRMKSGGGGGGGGSGGGSYDYSGGGGAGSYYGSTLGLVNWRRGL